MARLLKILVLIVLLIPVTSLQAVTTQRFQPLKDTLSAYSISKIPEASDYPEVPAVAILSLQEYTQSGMKHTRRYHKIVKILMPEGKEYANLHVPCFSSCRVEARTIKADGRVVNLPSRDLFHNENRSGYRSPYSIAQFAMPGVETGDIIEYIATVEYPVPFFLEDFRFSEPYPVVKGIFSLIHPVGDSYAFVRHSPPGGPVVKFSQNKIAEGQISLSRTTFVVDNVRPAQEEPYAPEARQDFPGIRLILESRSGKSLDIFKDWLSYGNFITSQIQFPSVIDNEIIRFAQNAAGDRTDVREIIQAIYSDAEKRIQITDETLWLSGFEFRSPANVMKEKVASPHDFALFLAACFKIKKWTSDLVLVNSHKKAETSKDAVFPPDLDLVFLNIKTPIGEFVIDCSKNGMPPFQLSSAGMNRFALAIPLFVVSTRFTNAGTYTSRTSYKDGNRHHMEITAIPAQNLWNIDFRWTMAGEYQSEWIRLFRQKGDAELRKRLIHELLSHLDVFDLRDVEYSMKGNSLEVRGKASRARKILDSKTEVFQNEFWDSGFDVRPYVLENRTNRLLLPSVGEVSSTIRLRLPDPRVTLPTPVQLDSPPVRYALSFQKQNAEIVIEEKLLIRDMEVKPASFPKFSAFLDQYYEKHFWAILVRTE